MAFWLIPVSIIVGLFVWIIYTLRLDCNYQLSWLEKFGQSTDKLKDQVVWITGASSGIGEQVSLQLARIGCKLVLSARNQQSLEHIKQQCLELNSTLREEDVLVLPLDVTELSSHETSFKAVIAQFSRLDVIINNAGVAQSGPFEQIEVDLDRRVFDTNVFGPLSLTRLVCRHWLRNGQAGHVVLNSSTSAIIRNPWSSTYVASKAAISAYMETMAREYYQKPIRCTVIYPGPIKTKIFSNSYRWRLGQSYDQDFVHESEKSGVFKWISSQRCGELFAIAIANQVSSCWIACQPILGFTFLSYYLPFLSDYVWRQTLRLKQHSLKQLYLK